MLYEVITVLAQKLRTRRFAKGSIAFERSEVVITSYSIHYTKLYDKALSVLFMLNNMNRF